MSAGHSQRRLAAILAADVVGYSRLMGQDEAGTLAALKAIRVELIDPKITEHHGRVFKTTGDGLLAEFPSVVNAVSCAVAVQDAMSKCAGKPTIQLRIGINVGDVVVEEGDVFGDGVNVAARIESLAPPGGIALTETAREHLGSRLKLDFTDTGTHSLNNIEKPIRVFAIETNGSNSSPSQSKHQTFDLPSIVILPFLNISHDPEQEYIADGLTEDLISELSRFRSLRVMSRNSSFRYRDKEVDPIRVGRELGVGYLVEGSLRKVGPRIRVTAQLIDATTGSHIWADRYDRPQDEFFDVQDQVVRTIVSTLVGRIQAAGAELTKRRAPTSLAAYECLLRAEALPWNDPAGSTEARKLCERALELDPHCARAFSLLAILDRRKWEDNLTASNTLLDVALTNAKRAVAIDPNDAYCHHYLAEVYLYRGAHDLAERHFLKSLELNPNRPGFVIGLAHLYHYAGRGEDALAQFAVAKSIDPFFEPPWYWSSLLMIRYGARQYQKGLDAFRRIADPSDWAHTLAGACYAMLGDQEGAKYHIGEALKLRPSLTIALNLSRDPWKNKKDRDHFIEGLRKAGLPE